MTRHRSEADVGNMRFRSVILAGALLAWACSGSTGGSAAGTAGTTGTGGTGTGGAATGVTVNLGATRQTIEGFGFNTALSSTTPNWDTFFTTTGSGLGLSIVRVAMQPNSSLS